jgi:hypothetical protein
MPSFVKLSQVPFNGDLDLTALPKHHRAPSHHLTFEEAVDVHMRLAAREIYSRIAARYDVNQGRIADVKFGRLHPGSYEEAQRRMGK